MGRCWKSLIVLLVAAGLAVAAALALLVFFPPAFRLGLRVANALLPVEIQVDVYRHLPGSMRLEGVRVLTSEGEVFCSLERLEAFYSLKKLFAGRLEFSRIGVDGPRLDLRAIPGAAAEAGVAAEGPRHAPFAVPVLPAWMTVEKVEIRQAFVVWQEPASNLSFALESGEMLGRFVPHPESLHVDRLRGDLVVRGDKEIRARVEGRAFFAEGALHLETFALETDSYRLGLRGSYQLSSGQMEAVASLDSVPLAEILEAFGVTGVPFEKVGGTVSAEGAAPDRVGLQGDLNASLFGQDLRLLLAGGIEKDRLFFDSIRAAHGEASISGRASWTFSTGNLEGAYELNAPRLEKLLAALGAEGAAFESLSVAGELGGTVEKPLLRFRLRSGGFVYRQPIFGGLSLEGEFRPPGEVMIEGNSARFTLVRGALPASRFRLDMGEGRLEATFEAGPSLRAKGIWNVPEHRAEADLRVRGLRLDPFLLGIVPKLGESRLTAAGTFRGDPARQETWTGALRVQDIRVSAPGLEVRNAAPFALALAESTVRGELALLANGGRLQAAGRYSLGRTGPKDVRLEGTLPIEPVEPFLQALVPGIQEARGSLSVRAALQGSSAGPALSVRGTLSEGFLRLVAPGDGEGPPVFEGRIDLDLDLRGSPSAPAGTARIAAAEMSLYGVPFDSLGLGLESDGKSISIREGSLCGLEGILALQGRAEWKTGAVSGVVRSESWAIEPVLARFGVPASGIASIEANLDGTFEAPKGELRIQGRQLALRDEAIEDVAVYAVYQSGSLRMESRTSSGSLQAGVVLSEGFRALAAEFRLESLELEPFLSLARPGLAKGRVSLSGNLSGPLRNGADWKGSALVEKLEAEAGGFPVRLVAPVSLGIAGGILTIPDALFSLGEGEIRVKGFLGRSSDVALSGRVPLRMATSFLPWLRVVSGEGRLAFRLTGPLDSPVLEGSADLSAQQVSIAGYGYPFEDVRARLLGSAEGIVLESLVARAGDGEVRASGRATLGPLFQVDRCDLQFTSLPVRVSEDVPARIGGALSFSGSARGSRLSGRVRILEARYERDFELVGAVLRPTRPSQVRVKKPSPFLENLELDVNVVSGPDLMVRNNVARILLSMDLDIRGTAASPAPLGKVDVVEGKIYLLKKQFDISEGSLSFLGPGAAKPLLHVESRVDVRGASRDYVVYLSLDGPLDRIELGLRSIPDLSREDVLFVLVTGKTQAEYFSSAGAGDTKSGASQLAVSGFSLLFGEDVRRATGLDVFELETAEGQQQGMRTILGKRVNERMELRGIFAFGSAHQASEAQVEYRLTDTIFLVGTQRTDGSFGLDVRLRFLSR